jgi:hypothetical protein
VLIESVPILSIEGGFEFGIWCAWQESNLLPFGPEPNALSGELQARAP